MGDGTRSCIVRCNLLHSVIFLEQKEYKGFRAVQRKPNEGVLGSRVCSDIILIINKSLLSALHIHRGKNKIKRGEFFSKKNLSILG